MSNFIGMVFATLKKEGIDTSKMDTSEAIAKYNEIQGSGGGSSTKGEETPKTEQKTATKATDKKNLAVDEGTTEKDSADATVSKKETVEETGVISQDKQRDDRYTTGNPDNISKQSNIANIGNDLQNYKGSGSADLVLPGGKFVQIRPQKDGSFLVRTSNGQKYVSSVDDAKQEAVNAYGGSSTQHGAINTAEKMSTAMGISPDEAKAFVSGKGSLTKGGYEGVSNVKSAPTFEYNTTKKVSTWEEAQTYIKDIKQKINELNNQLNNAPNNETKNNINLQIANLKYELANFYDENDVDSLWLKRNK